MLCWPGCGVCVSGGKQRLVKTFTAWKILASLENTGKPGKYWQTVSEAERYWGICFSENNGRTAVVQGDAVRQSRPAPAAKRLIFWRKNNGRTATAIFDNSYRKCYNKCNDDNKKAISHQTGKNASVSRFSSLGYNFPLSRQKRRTANWHKIW